jgi:8-oxo-dGTP pyrophosphatase MutT (NUDIX family)
VALELGLFRRALEGSLAAAQNDATRSPEPQAETAAIRRAAVALILREASETARAELSSVGSPQVDTEILLIRRAEHELDPWSGHMALPGGRQDPTDLSLLHTVERETREEVGIDLTRHAELIGRLPEMPAVARGRQVGMTIAPFVFVVRGDPSLSLNVEVAESLWASLSLLSSGRVDTTVPYARPDSSLSMQFPGWDVAGRIVWGLTHRMISMLLEAGVVARAAAHDLATP